MKKILYCFLIAATISSCSNDENSNEPEKSNVLVTKIIKKYSSSDIATNEFLYEDNKILTERNNTGFLRKFTYDENVIIRIEETVNNNFQNSRDYSYKDGKLIKMVLKQNYGGTIMYTYTHKDDGNVSYIKTQTGSENSTGFLLISNGNIIENTVTYGGKYPSTVTYKFEYDNKNNPFKNVLGFNLLLDDQEMFSSNNLTKDGSGEPPYYFTLLYDDNNFPTSRKNIQSNEIIDFYYK